MKKLLVLIVALCMVALPVLAETAEVDAFTTASVNNYYGMIEGDALCDALNSHAGFYVIASVNPDGTPNVGFYIYGCKKLNDTYYLQLGLAPNQTTANVDAGSELVAMYAALPAPDADPYPVTGARMNLAKVEDQAVLDELNKDAGGYTPMYYEITLVRPLG